MRAIIEVLHAIAFWFVTGGVGMKPFTSGLVARPHAPRESAHQARVPPRTAA